MPLVLSGSTGIVEGNIANDAITTNKIASDAITTSKIASLAASKLTGQVPDANAPSGSVIQVVQSYKTNIFTTTSVNYVEVPGLIANITPISTNSKILIQVNLNAGIVGNAAGVQLWRNNAAIALPDSVAGKNHRLWINIYNGGDDANSTPNWGMMFLDSPSSTQQLTYAVRVACVQGGGTIVINDQTSQVSNQSFAGNSVSHITLMEIAA
jgi:hypothetical protein